MTTTAPRPIDPLKPIAMGRYEDDIVVVRHAAARPGAVRTRHFGLWMHEGKLHVTHGLAAHNIDNDLAGLVAEELFGTGWLSGSEAFERVLTGIVLTSAADPDAAWELFYRNTLERLTGPSVGPAAVGSLAAYRPVYEHALSLVPSGSALEMGCCFGFLSLRLAGRAQMTASDVTPNTMRLLGRMAPLLGRALETIVCDAARVPRPDRSFDTVMAVHLLEHLEPDHGAAVLVEALRLARSRVFVAVPFEDAPTAVFGHVRTFGLDDLCHLGAASDWAWSAYEHHGGWLVLDRPGGLR